MSTTIQIKRSSTASAVPLLGDLAVGELAVNLADKRLFAKQADGTIIELSTNPTDLDAATLRIDGVEITASATELNSLDGLTATTAELNILDGVTATTTELNKLDGFTGSTAELNILDGVTATTAELNFVDGVTSNVQTQLNAKQPLDAQLTDIAGLTPTDGSFIVGNGVNFVAESGNTAIVSLGVTATAAELNTLDGVTATTTELNYTDGVTSNIQTQLNSKAATTTSPTITLAGDLSGSATLTNLGNATLTATVADDSHNHVISNVDGLQTALDSKANLSGANFTGSVDVTGTVTADGLTVDAATGIALKTGSSTEATWTHEVATGESTISVGRNSSWGADFNIETDTKRRLRINTGGDVSFYEDTGTTAKMVWDASAEGLNITSSTGSPEVSLSSDSNTTALKLDNTATSGRAFQIMSHGGGSSLASKLSIYDEDAGLHRFVLDSAGNVGIGTASPSGKLHADVSGTADALVLSRDGGANGKLEIDFDSAFTNFNSATGGYTFSQNTNERARIDSSGNLLVAKSAISTATVGHMALSSGLLASTRSGGEVAVLNRLASDGDIVQFRKDGSSVGSIGSRAESIYIGKNDTGISFTDTGDAVYPVSPSGLSVRDAAIDLGTSGARFKDLYLSGGVYLGGTGAANKLDDYEEGNWTPSIRIGSTSYSPSVTTQAKYVKVGKLVHVYVHCDFTGLPINNGLLIYVAGIPFSSDGLQPVNLSISETYSDTNLFISSEAQKITGGTLENNNSLLLSDAGFAYVRDNAINSAGKFMFTASYKTQS